MAIASEPASLAAASIRSLPRAKRDVPAALRQTDTDATPKTTRRPNDHCP